MFNRHSIRIVEHCTAGIALMLALVPIGLCQTTPEQESEQASSDTMEEIVVYGDKSIVLLRREFHRAEENFFDVFNSLNSTDEFDIKCEYVVDLGSRRRHHLCMSKFARKAEYWATQDMLAGAGMAMDFPNWNLNTAKLNKQDELLWQEMSSLLSEHLELQKAFNDLTERKRNYESEGQKSEVVEDGL